LILDVKKLEVNKAKYPMGKHSYTKTRKNLQKLFPDISVDLVKRLNTELSSDVRFSAVGFVPSIAASGTAAALFAVY
jgi:hypothetical protein